MTTPRPLPSWMHISRVKISNGFTLVEMLITVGIIAILAVLLFPAISKMKEAGQSAQCLGNLRSLGQFGISYSVEHNGNMPQYYVGGTYPYSPPGAAAYWFDVYCGYNEITHPDIRRNLPPALTCPVNKKTSPGGWGGRNGARTWAINWGTGYSGTPADWNNQAPHQWVKYGQIKQYPSNKIVSLDSLSKTAWFIDGTGTDFLHAQAKQTDLFKRPHNGKTNVLYFDGHAATVEIPDFTKVPSSVLNQQVWIDFFGNKG